ncbi:hypothetical protein [Pseudopelagicola sp. nBUS_19]
MLHQIRYLIRNSRETLAQDAIGGVTLAVMMVVVLHTPNFF